MTDDTEGTGPLWPGIHLAEDAPLLEMSVQEIKAAVAQDDEAEDLCPRLTSRMDCLC